MTSATTRSISAAGSPCTRTAGTRIDLSTGCPAVYKYAYLMDQHAPLFGHENVANPLAWKIRSDSPDARYERDRVSRARCEQRGARRLDVAHRGRAGHLPRRAVSRCDREARHDDRAVPGRRAVPQHRRQRHDPERVLRQSPARGAALDRAHPARRAVLVLVREPQQDLELLIGTGPSAYDLPITQYTSEPVA